MAKFRDLNTVPEEHRERFALGNAVKSSGFVKATVGDKTYEGKDMPTRKAFHSALRHRRNKPISITLNF